MARNAQSGFTILEVIIFLAISALLLMVVMVGTGRALNRQRYDDGVRTLESFLQKQADGTLSVANDRPETQSCNDLVEVRLVAPEPRGTSDCVIMGKAIGFSNGDGRISVKPILGIEPDPTTLPQDRDGDEASIIMSYKPTISDLPGSTEEYTIPWGITVDNVRRANPDGSNPDHPITMVALVRSPRSGGLLVLSYENTPGEGRLYSEDIAEVSGKVTNVCLQSSEVSNSTSIIQLGQVGNQSAVQALFARDRTAECQ